MSTTVDDPDSNGGGDTLSMDKSADNGDVDGKSDGDDDGNGKDDGSDDDDDDGKSDGVGLNCSRGPQVSPCTSSTLLPTTNMMESTAEFSSPLSFFTLT